MDYKDMHEAALQTARQWIADGCSDAERIALEAVFPQLRESEDERLLNTIISGFEAWKGNGNVKFNNTDVDDILVYLKKQKEQKPLKVGENAYFDPNTDMWFIKKEQKPVEPSIDELQRREEEFYNFKVFAAKQAKEHHISFVHDFEWNNFCAELLSYFNERQQPESASASTMIPSCWEEKQKPESDTTLYVFSDGSTMPIKQKEQKSCLTCDEYDKGYKQGYTEGCTAGYNKAMKEVEQKKQKPEPHQAQVCEEIELTDFENALFTAFSYAWQDYLSGKEVNVVEWVKEESPELLAVALQKQEWSANDRAFIKDCAHILDKNGYAASSERLLSMFEQKPAEIDERRIINKHITEDSLSSEVNKRLKECGWYVTEEKSAEWSEKEEKIISNIRHLIFDHAFENGGVDVNGDYCKDVYEQADDFLDSLRPQKLDASKLENFDPVDVLNEIKTKWPMAWEKVVGKQEWSEEEKEKIRQNGRLDVCYNPEKYGLCHKIEWSEEECGRLFDIEHYLDGTLQLTPDRKIKCIDFIKSLCPQLKQEWSEEDERNFEWFDKFFRAESVVAGGRDIPQDKYLWFKSLRPQPKWKPSEQEKGALRTAIYVLTEERNFPKAAEQLQNILDAFEEKESRKDWKPSEEQMEALRTSYSYWRGITNEVPKSSELESLYNDLNKQR